MKKPSERIQEILSDKIGFLELVALPPSERMLEMRVNAIIQYLDEQAALEESAKPHQVKI